MTPDPKALIARLDDAARIIEAAFDARDAAALIREAARALEAQERQPSRELTPNMMAAGCRFLTDTDTSGMSNGELVSAFYTAIIAAAPVKS